MDLQTALAQNLTLIEAGLASLTLPGNSHSLREAATEQLQMGGKRLRPLACLLVSNAFGEAGPQSANALHAALALEVFHNFTLAHDDIMDNAALRRGQPTLFARHGAPTAILAGDALFVLAYEQLALLPSALFAKAAARFNTMAMRVCIGQQLDMEFETRDGVSVEDYLDMIGQKTSVLLGCAMALGAMCGGASDEQIELADGVGVALGIAFQLQDDYLDCFGTPETFGKTPGGDIASGKKTFLHLHAMAAAHPSERALLEGRGTQDGRVGRVLALYRSLGSDVASAKLAEEYAAKAQQLADKLPAKPKQVLNAFINFVLSRTH